MNHHRNGLMQLQRDDQEAKIRELKRKQLEFYKKQKVCETFATLTVISSFASMFHVSKIFYHHLMDMRFVWNIFGTPFCGQWTMQCHWLKWISLIKSVEVATFSGFPNSKLFSFLAVRDIPIWFWLLVQSTVFHHLQELHCSPIHWREHKLDLQVEDFIALSIENKSVIFKNWWLLGMVQVNIIHIVSYSLDVLWLMFSGRWVHTSSYCEWEWVSGERGVSQTGCNMPNIE